MFWRVGTIPSTAVMCCCSRVRGAEVDGTCVMGGEEEPVVALGATVKRAGAVHVVVGAAGTGKVAVLKRHWFGRT
jgi:hypothetical protein